MKPLMLVELNEINFGVVKRYIELGVELPFFSRLFAEGVLETYAEDCYENLEPWIQWPSVHTGRTYSEHGVFRLGDSISLQHEQIFEKLEKSGYTVGALSPMNAVNKLQSPAFFVPDPWTDTNSDGSFFSRSLTSLLRQSVNDNAAEKLTIASAFKLILCFVRFIPLRQYWYFSRLALAALGGRWRKAIFLDAFLIQIYRFLVRSHKPDFSVIFLNAGAHIQHHYFLNSAALHECENLKSNPEWYVNSSQDPVREVIQAYDAMLVELLEDNYEIIVATGLQQLPYTTPFFYYRLKDHKSFLSMLGVEFIDVQPRMTRDFLVTFADVGKASQAEVTLRSVRTRDGTPLFESVDNRGCSLFVTLTFADAIRETTAVEVSGKEVLLGDHFCFVAIKNGGHDGTGYVSVSNGLRAYLPNGPLHVAKLHDLILQYFDSDQKASR